MPINLTVDFQESISRGKVGEDIFSRQFLDFLGIRYVNVANCQQFQAQDIDLNTAIGTYEIKTNYRDDNQIIIEDFTNCNAELGNISLGWMYKCNADLLVCVSKKTEIMVLIPMTTEFKAHYERIKDGFRLIENRITVNGGNSWQSAFRFIPLHAIEGFYSFYKRPKKAI